MVSVWARCLEREAEKLRKMLDARNVTLHGLLDFDEQMRDIHVSISQTVRQHLKLNNLE